MKTPVRSVLLLTAPWLIAAGVLYARSASGPQLDRRAADQFVPFSAETRITTETGAIVVGRFYRRSDGSTRAETGKVLGAPSVILINNFSTRTVYVWRAADGGWIAHPIDHPIPLPWHPDEKSLVRMIPVQESVDGLELLRKDNPGSSGTYALVAPRLNYYPVITRICPESTAGDENRCTTNSKFNIQIGEPPAELFEPGEGERVAKSSTPFGPQPRREPK